MGQVPEAVRQADGEFYQCGVCLQVFWPGAKYDATMDSLKQAALDGEGEAVAGAAEGSGAPEAAPTSGSPAAGFPHGATVRNYTPREGKVERT